VLWPQSPFYQVKYWHSWTRRIGYVWKSVIGDVKKYRNRSFTRPNAIQPNPIQSVSNSGELSFSAACLLHVNVMLMHSVSISVVFWGVMLLVAAFDVKNRSIAVAGVVMQRKMFIYLKMPATRHLKSLYVVRNAVSSLEYLATFDLTTFAKVAQRRQISDWLMQPIGNHYGAHWHNRLNNGSRWMTLLQKPGRMTSHSISPN